MLLPLLLVSSIAISAAAKGQLKPSTIPYYSDARKGQIEAHEEGEEGTLKRSGLIPVGKKIHLLNVPTEKIARDWARFLCKNLKSLDSVNFPAGKWTQLPGKNCTLEKVQAFIIDTGAFKNTAVVQANWALIPGSAGVPPASNDTSADNVHISAAALLEINSDMTPSAILKVVGGLQNAGDMSGSASLEFVTPKQIVLRFNGYVSQCQIVLRKLQGARDIHVDILK